MKHEVVRFTEPVQVTGDEPLLIQYDLEHQSIARIFIDGKEVPFERISMAQQDEEITCPKPACTSPKESVTRRHAGRTISICGNGHSFDKDEIRQQRSKAEAANRQENFSLSEGLKGIDFSDILERQMRDSFVPKPFQQHEERVFRSKRDALRKYLGDD